MKSSPSQRTHRHLAIGIGLDNQVGNSRSLQVPRHTPGWAGHPRSSDTPPVGYPSPPTRSLDIPPVGYPPPSRNWQWCVEDAVQQAVQAVLPSLQEAPQQPPATTADGPPPPSSTVPALTTTTATVSQAATGTAPQAATGTAAASGESIVQYCHVRAKGEERRTA